MKRILGLLALLALSTLPAVAQVNAPKVEVGGGYTFRSLDGLGGPRINMNGWNATAAFDFADWLGLALDVDGAYATSQGVKLRQYTFMAGPRVYPLGHRTIAPFVHALAGISRFTVDDPTAPPPFTDNVFAFAFGGGVDAKVTSHVAIRVGEFDFEDTHNFHNPAQKNFKFKAGVIFRF